MNNVFYFINCSVFSSLKILVQQRYVVVVMMFLSMTFTFFLRMNFPIVLTQMVYVPNINQTFSSDIKSNSELICPNKDHIVNNHTDLDPVANTFMVILFFVFFCFYCHC